MKKSHAIYLLGGTPEKAAAKIGITVQAISMWPDVLSPKIKDRVEAAYHRSKRRTLPEQKQAVASIECATAAIETVAEA